ncbi:dihydrofolate reductase family protein [Nanoarchaeota archaeon]
MKIVLYMAMTPNGIIARSNNKEDFLSDKHWKTLCDLTKKYKCLIWGRKTYEIVKKWEKRYMNSLKCKKKIIISSKPSLKLDKDCCLANSPKKALQEIKKQGFKTALLCGGAKINSAFIKANLIDEIILNIEPTLLGKGIHVFHEENFEKKLSLLKTKKISQNIVQLHYRIKK